MKQEKSCGCVIIDKNKVLLIKHKKGHWGFPKGHIEKGETLKETAIREVKEETNIDVEIIKEKQYEMEYSPEEGIMKKVIFFIAKPTSKEAKPQETEVQKVEWVTIEEAIEKLTFDNAREILKKIREEK